MARDRNTRGKKPVRRSSRITDPLLLYEDIIDIEYEDGPHMLLVSLDNRACELHALHKHLIRRGDSLLVCMDEGNVLRTTRVKQGSVSPRNWAAKVERRLLHTTNHAATLLSELCRMIAEGETQYRQALAERDDAIWRWKEMEKLYYEIRDEMLEQERRLAEEALIIELRASQPSTELVDVAADLDRSMTTYLCSCESCIRRRNSETCEKRVFDVESNPCQSLVNVDKGDMANSTPVDDVGTSGDV
ncbi:hypothetical protein CBR_g6482 [Chara braunii]|uniref:Uncharacterized protein n=1 Tax=Chara braunii TaxID=69332 RepID=A0A388KJX4_CHABU|nr:hypothetical protein CBR_g6482 [Chara braunii]|eukprot:GBG70354.1 hypothetical protein CBR_g6482 [Chara braunii]